MTDVPVAVMPRKALMFERNCLESSSIHDSMPRLFHKSVCYTAVVNESADVLIIGGGVIGSSIAFNLKKDGFTGRVVVVERDPSYQFASSALAMGGVREQYMSRVNVAMAQYSISLFEK